MLQTVVSTKFGGIYLIVSDVSYERKISLKVRTAHLT